MDSTAAERYGWPCNVTCVTNARNATIAMDRSAKGDGLDATKPYTSLTTISKTKGSISLNSSTLSQPSIATIVQSGWRWRHCKHGDLNAKILLNSSLLPIWMQIMLVNNHRTHLLIHDIGNLTKHYIIVHKRIGKVDKIALQYVHKTIINKTTQKGTRRSLQHLVSYDMSKWQYFAWFSASKKSPRSISRFQDPHSNQGVAWQRYTLGQMWSLTTLHGQRLNQDVPTS